MNKKNRIRVGVGYIRESTEEQDKGFSPENQKRTIEEYAKKNNIKIEKFYKDLVSGKSVLKREDFQVMIEDATQKKFEVIIVFHTSRFARNVEEARQYKNLLREKLRIDVISATQQFGDFKNPSVFLNEGVNELFDEYYSKQLSFWLRTSLAEKRRQGKPIGAPPFGYFKERIGYDKDKDRVIYKKNWSVNKEQSKIVNKIFEMYATGRYSMNMIANQLTNEGLKTRYGNPFGYSSIKCMLRNKTYLGLVWSPRKDLPDLKSVIHKPIITKELFYKCQEVANSRSGSCGRPIAQHRFYLLQGLVYCYHCRTELNKKSKDSIIRRMQPSMYCDTHKWRTGEKQYYTCKFKKENNCCKGRNSECDVIDSQVIDFMGGFKLTEDVVKRTLEKLKEKLENLQKPDKKDKQIVSLQSKKKRLKFLFFNSGDLTEDEYLLEKQKIEENIWKLSGNNTNKGFSKFGKIKILKATENFLRDFSVLWNSRIGQDERKKWIQLTIKRVWVEDDKVVAIEPKDDYKDLFDIHKKVIAQVPLVAQKTKTPPRMGRCFYCLLERLEGIGQTQAPG